MISVSDYETISIDMLGTPIAKLFTNEDNIAYYLAYNGKVKRVFLSEYNCQRALYKFKKRSRQWSKVTTEPIFLFIKGII